MIATSTIVEQTKMKINKQATHRILAMPNVNDHDQYFIPKANSLGRKIKNHIFYFQN
jgi:hypothetical protein